MCIILSDDETFWVFNDYALTRGTLFGGEDGRWGKRFGSYAFSAPGEGDFETDGDVDGPSMATFVADFGRTNCP